MHDVKILLEAPDVYIAATALHDLRFYVGKGDRTAFFEIVLETNPSLIPDLYRKLQLVTQKEFMDLDLYNDGKLCSPERLGRKTIYRLWLHCVRKSKVLTLQQMIDLQPHAKIWLNRYDKFVDEDGKTTLNIKE